MKKFIRPADEKIHVCIPPNTFPIIKKGKEYAKQVLAKKERFIEKKNKPKKVKSKYKHTTSDYQIYHTFIDAGAIKHKEGTKAFVKTLDKIHALFSLKCKNPFDSPHIFPQYKEKKWTVDEVIDAFKLQLQYATRPTRNAGDFIFTKGWGSVQSYSPLVIWYREMTSGRFSLSEDGEYLIKKFNRQGIPTKGLNNQDFNIVCQRINQLSGNGYSWHRQNEGITALDYFVDYMKEKVNKSQDFRVVYMRGEKLIDDFKEECIRKGVLRREGISYLGMQVQ